jgi:hypothetical protein
MRDAMVEGKIFSPSEYGTVLNAGEGEASEELIATMQVKFGLNHTKRPQRAVEDHNSEKITFDYKIFNP